MTDDQRPVRGADGRTGFSRLTCYQINDMAPRIVPAAPERPWMDETRERFAYRCLPLTIANSIGWELLLPFAISAEWNGGPELSDIVVSAPDGGDAGQYASSHFGHGVLTFQTHYLFRTEPGVALWARGSPNRPKDGIAPLDGITETDWLTFTFTMNWIFTRPGRVDFARDEPYCFITPIGYRGLDSLVPEITPMQEHPDVLAAYAEHRLLRLEFNERLSKGDPETVKQGWQKWYFRGQTPAGDVGNPLHLSKIRLASPRQGERIGKSPP
jgi:hypothetical protein